MFYVINRDTGEQVFAKGIWALDEDGQLIDVQDGWGCEGGGGSDKAPDRYVAVFGSPPKPEPEPIKEVQVAKDYNSRCTCGARFIEFSSGIKHCNDTKKPGSHSISEI